MRATVVRVGGLRSGTGSLLGSRFLDQIALGVGSLMLAAKLGPAPFAPVGALFIANTIAVTLADQGAALDVLRGRTGDEISLAGWRRLRNRNLAVAGSAVLVGIALSGPWASVLVAAGAIWCLAAMAGIRKAHLIRHGASITAARAERTGTLVWACAVGVAWVSSPDASVWLVGGAFVAKQLVESLVAGPVPLGPDAAIRPGAVWVSQGLAYAIANLDYLVVAVGFGAASFSLYNLAFRVANLVPSQIASVIGRVMLVEHGEPHSSQQQVYNRYVGRLMAVGAVLAICTMAAAPLVPLVLGDAWADIVPLVVVLAVAVPWRLTFGQVATLLLTSGEERRLVGWEIVRLLLTVFTLAVAALHSLAALVTAVSMLQIALAACGHVLACHRRGIRPSRLVAAGAIPATVLVLTLGVALPIGTV